jgi:hypothetical protein
MPATNLVPGRWYVDARGYGGAPTRARFKLLSVAAETVLVEDEWGGKRDVNRTMWVSDMEVA